MAYTMLNNSAIRPRKYATNSLEGAALSFIRESCEGLRFDKNKATSISDGNLDFEGRSLKLNQIPFNMEKDIDRLCMENAIDRFMKSGKKEDAFDVYFCYLEMFVEEYEKNRRMIKLLSEFEVNGSGHHMKHREPYSHSVYVFVVGLAMYKSNEIFREIYKKFYGIENDYEAAAHYLKFWGLTSLFHDIGYPFEIPFEQVCSYFETDGDKRSGRPFIAYHFLDDFVSISDDVQDKISTLFDGKKCSTTDELFAFALAEQLGGTYGFTEEKMLGILKEKPASPNKFNYFMDHAYFSATILFKKFIEEMQADICHAHVDALTAILMHNSLYKFSITNYKSEGNKPFKAELHPLAYMLMLCDELQCWDRTAYGRNSKIELYPMGCIFDFLDNNIKAVYLYDEKEMAKVNRFKDNYIEWIQSQKTRKEPNLKAYSGMFIKKNGISVFQDDIERIVDLSDIRLCVETGLAEHVHAGNRGFLSDSNFNNLYNFAIILNGRWANDDWKKAKEAGQEDEFINDSSVRLKYAEEFKNLSLEYKIFNINQAKAFAKYMNEIGCFYTDKTVDFEQVERFTDEELVKIGLLEHRRWLQDHYDMGWTYGTPDKEKRDFERKHRDMIPQFEKFDVSDEEAKYNYERLDKETQDKDSEPMECMLSLLKMFDGLRIYRIAGK